MVLSITLSIIRNLHLKRVMANVLNVFLLGVPGMYFYKNAQIHSWEYLFLMGGIGVMILKMMVTLSGKGETVFDGWFDESNTLFKRKKKKPKARVVNNPLRSEAYSNDDGPF